MISAKRVEANRANAKKSTGPRTVRGKSRVSRNAVRHGLRAMLSHDPAVSAEVKRMARAICGKSTNAALYDAALRVAEYDLLIRRIRAARLAAIKRHIHMTTVAAPAMKPKQTVGFPTAEEYEHGLCELARGRPHVMTKLLNRGARAVRAGTAQPKEANKPEQQAAQSAAVEYQRAVDDLAPAHELQEPVDRSPPKVPDEVRAILGALPHLRKFDRYEKRALARRERAICSLLAAQSSS
jgi:hypothetical protein